MKSGIYLIWDLPLAVDDPEEFFAALKGDLPCAVQLRAKGYDQVPSCLNKLISACRRYQIPLFINDQPAWLRPGVYGIHLGQGDGSSAGFEGFEVGRSTHDLQQVDEATRDAQVSCLGFGPVFVTASKKAALPPRGLALLAEAVQTARGKPLIAIGGITLETLPQIKRSGCHAAAVIGAVWRAPNPQESCRRLVQAWRFL
jgi:thiamine-phosphate pyrophosphorylase